MAKALRSASQRLEYPISPEYGKNWTEEMALRELIANEIDAVGEDFTISLTDGVLLISDRGEGLKAKHLVMGVSEKSSGQSIGQFGEGLKMAALVYAGRGVPVSILAGDREMEFTCEESETFETKVLVLRWRKAEKPVVGTRILIAKVSKAAYQAARARFLIFRPKKEGAYLWLDKENGILDEPGSVYVRGVRVQDGLSSLFGYVVENQKLMNRDRTVIDHTVLQHEIFTSLRSTKSADVIAKFLKACLRPVEGHLPLELTGSIVSFKYREVWTEILLSQTGKRAAISCGTEHDLVARDRGWKLFEVPNSIALTTLIALGMKRTFDVVKIKEKKKKIKRVQKSELGSLRRKWSLAKRFARRALMAMYGKEVEIPKMKLVRQFSVETHECTLGMFRDGVCEILLSHFKSSELPKVVGTIIHEFGHGKSNAYDRTREFENWLTDMIGVLATKKKYRPLK